MKIRSRRQDQGAGGRRGQRERDKTKEQEVLGGEGEMDKNNENEVGRGEVG